MPCCRQLSFLSANVELIVGGASFIERGDVVRKLSASRKQQHTVALDACGLLITQCSIFWVQFFCGKYFSLSLFDRRLNALIDVLGI